MGDSSTFGKGTVQTIIPLAQIMSGRLTPAEDPGALKTTISKFYRPSGKSTQIQGVKSDIVLPSLTDVPEISENEMQNPLPWDTVPSALFASTDSVGLPEYLALRSAERIAKDPISSNSKEIASNCAERARRNRSPSTKQSVAVKKQSSRRAWKRARKSRRSRLGTAVDV